METNLLYSTDLNKEFSINNFKELFEDKINWLDIKENREIIFKDINEFIENKNWNFLEKIIDNIKSWYEEYKINNSNIFSEEKFEIEDFDLPDIEEEINISFIEKSFNYWNSMNKNSNSLKLKNWNSLTIENRTYKIYDWKELVEEFNNKQNLFYYLYENRKELLDFNVLNSIRK